MSRKKIAAANWKMNTTVDEGKALLAELLENDLDAAVDVVICAPFTHLHTLMHAFKGANIYLGAQNMSEHEKGAYTGEISLDMLKACGVSHVIIGHSERREYFNEDNILLGKKLAKALEAGMIPIFCCGENLEIRKSENHVNHVIEQLTDSFDGFTADDLDSLVLAYEPIWAIGTGETASPQQAQEMHREIRVFLKKAFGAELADKVPILYGGSVKPSNAKEIFSMPDVDGGLVGGASLKADLFAGVINSFS